MSGASQSVAGAALAIDSPCRFDWYAATVQGDPFTTLSDLAGYLGCEVKPQGRGYVGYNEAFDLVDSKGVRARAACGGVNPGLHAWASGEDTDRFVETVRAGWPEHRVARADSAFDFDTPGAWSALFDVCKAFAFDRRLKVDQQGDWLRGDDGRTFYVGSRKSASFVRLYEKGKQVAGELVSESEKAKVSRDWVRLELQLRPQRTAKSVVAGLAPAEVWAVSTWTRDLVRDALALDLEPVTASAYRESDDDRALHYLVKQYGGLLSRIAAAQDDRWGGQWAGLGVLLGRLVDADGMESRELLHQGEKVRKLGESRVDLVPQYVRPVEPLRDRFGQLIPDWS